MALQDLNIRPPAPRAAPRANNIGSFLAQNSNMITQLGLGMIGGTNMERMRGAATGIANGANLDRQLATQRQAEETTRNEQNQTRQWMERSAPNAFAQLNAGLPMGEAYKLAMSEYQTANGPAPERRMTEAADGYKYYNDGTRAFPDVVATPDAPPSTQTGSQKDYEFARTQGFNGTFLEYKTQLAQAGSGQFNQNQGNAAGFADRMSNANSILSDPKMVTAMTDLGLQARSGVPIVGNFLSTPEMQMAEQAKRDFINAVLRQESGAAIAPSEFENADQQYFPQPGDSEVVIAQKARNREVAIQNLSRSAGPSYSAPSVAGDWLDLGGGTRIREVGQ